MRTQRKMGVTERGGNFPAIPEYQCGPTSQRKKTWAKGGDLQGGKTGGEGNNAPQILSTRRSAWRTSAGKKKENKNGPAKGSTEWGDMYERSLVLGLLINTWSGGGDRCEIDASRTLTSPGGGTGEMRKVFWVGVNSAR